MRERERDERARERERELREREREISPKPAADQRARAAHEKLIKKKRASDGGELARWATSLLTNKPVAAGQHVAFAPMGGGSGGSTATPAGRMLRIRGQLSAKP